MQLKQTVISLIYDLVIELYVIF